MTELKKRVSRKLRQLGGGCGLRGFGYVKTAVELCVEDETYLHGVTKRLYPETGRIHGVTPGKVERGIRHFVENTYSGNSIAVTEVLGVPPDMRSGRLSNTNFIAAIVETLKCDE